MACAVKRCKETRRCFPVACVRTASKPRIRNISRQNVITPNALYCGRRLNGFKIICRSNFFRDEKHGHRDREVSSVFRKRYGDILLAMILLIRFQSVAKRQACRIRPQIIRAILNGNNAIIIIIHKRNRLCVCRREYNTLSIHSIEIFVVLNQRRSDILLNFTASRRPAYKRRAVRKRCRRRRRFNRSILEINRFRRYASIDVIVYDFIKIRFF